MPQAPFVLCQRWYHTAGEQDDRLFARRPQGGPDPRRPPTGRLRGRGHPRLDPRRGRGRATPAEGGPLREPEPDRQGRGRSPRGLRRAVIVDTSALLAFFDAGEPDHHVVSAVLLDSPQPLVVSPYVVAEVDYLVASRLGVDAELAVLRELAGGAWDLPALGEADLAAAASVIERYADRAIGVADASNVVLAARYRTAVIATLDSRHFDVVRPLGGGRFTVLP